MKKYLILTIVVFIISKSNVFSQIFDNDSLSVDLNKIISTYEAAGYTFDKYEDECYISSDFKKNDIDLEKQMVNCGNIYFTYPHSSMIRIVNVYEYKDTLIVDELYREIEYFFTNSPVKKLEPNFKNIYIFKYKKYLCNSMFFCKKLSIEIKKLTGDYLLYYPRVNKYYN